MAQGSIGRPDDGARFESGKPWPAGNFDPTTYDSTPYGQQNTPGAGFAPPGYGPPSGYDQPHNYPPAGYPPYPFAPPPTNTMAILALVFAFVFSPLGIAFGIVARNQIARTGEAGSGMALAGLILGSVFTAFFVLYIIFIVFVFAAALSAIPSVS